MKEVQNNTELEQVTYDPAYKWEPMEVKKVSDDHAEKLLTNSSFKLIEKKETTTTKKTNVK